MMAARGSAVSTAAETDGATAAREEALLAAGLLDRLIASTGSIVIAVMLAGAIALVLWIDSRPPLLWTWLAAYLLLAGYGLWQQGRFRRIGDSALRAPLLLRHSMLVSALQGVVWGALAVDLALAHDVNGLALVCVAIAGQCAAKVASYSAHPPLVDAFVWPSLVPLAAATAFWGGPDHWALAVLCIVFGIAASLYARRAQAWLLAAHRATIEKDRLLVRLAATNDELQVTKQAAEAASHAKSMFLATMSHELRTPLNAIIGYSEMLLEDAEPHGDGQMIGDLRRINGAGQHLLSLVNDVLDLSKIEAGRMELSPSRFDLRACIDDIAASCRLQVEHKGNRFAVEVDALVGTVTADATKLRQVILNLLSNAGKFTTDGTVALTVTCERRDQVDWIIVAVRDTGIGMDQATVSRLFSDFTQAGSATSRKFGGTGLGLALSRRLCRLMGGDITVESALGVGSCFTACVRSDTAADSHQAPLVSTPAM